jgi:hypothetical protein
MADLVRRPEPRRDAGARTAGRRDPARRRSLGSGRALSDLLDRLVDSGAVVSGDVIIGLAGVDLIRLDLRLLLIGAESAIEAGAGAELRPAPVYRHDRPDRAGEVIEGAVIHDDAAGRADEYRRAGGRAEP